MPRFCRLRALGASLAVLVALAPAVVRAASPAPGCRAEADAHDVTLGPVDAPQTVQAWLDPLDPNALLTFVELRRLVADDRGRLRVDLDLARGDGQRQPLRDRVRVWAAAMGHADRIELALRELARDGPDRIAARLGTREARATLAQAMDLTAAAHQRAVADPCPARRLEQRTRALVAYFADNPASVRLPVFVVSGTVFDDSPTLDRLRPELGRAAMAERVSAPAPVLLPVQATHPAMRHPALGGIVLGGPGLAHRFVLQARDEDDASLFMMLPTVLQARRARPGVLAVQVVARGSSLGATTLRHRLCAARVLGREVAYLEVLAADPPSRERPPRDVTALLAALDKVPTAACKDESDPAQLDLPDGHWLDGLPRARPELANLEVTLLLLQRALRPLAPWLGGRTQD